MNTRSEMYKITNINNQSGAALIWTMILFFIIVIIATSLSFITNQDAVETVFHEINLKTYYVALSGTELGYAALMANVSGAPYINQFIANAAKTQTDTLDIVIGGTKMGEAVVTIDSVTIDGARWIRVNSVGRLEGETQTVSSVIRVDPNNIRNFVRERTSP